MFCSLKYGPAGLCYRDDLRAAILGVGLSHDQTVAFQSVDRLGHRSRSEIQRTGYVGRPTGSELAQEEQELAPGKRYAFFRHGLVHQPMNAMVELEQLVGNLECLLHDLMSYYEGPCEMAVTLLIVTIAAFVDQNHLKLGNDRRL